MNGSNHTLPTGKLWNTVFHKDQFDVLYFFFFTHMIYQKLLVDNPNHLIFRWYNHNIYRSKSQRFLKCVTVAFESFNKWFKANILSLNFDKTHFMQCTSKNSPQIDFDSTLLTNWFLNLMIKSFLKYVCRQDTILENS